MSCAVIHKGLPATYKPLLDIEGFGLIGFSSVNNQTKTPIDKIVIHIDTLKNNQLFQPLLSFQQIKDIAEQLDPSDSDNNELCFTVGEDAHMVLALLTDKQLTACFGWNAEEVAASQLETLEHLINLKYDYFLHLHELKNALTGNGQSIRNKLKHSAHPFYYLGQSYDDCYWNIPSKLIYFFIEDQAKDEQDFGIIVLEETAKMLEKARGLPLNPFLMQQALAVDDENDFLMGNSNPYTIFNLDRSFPPLKIPSPKPDTFYYVKHKKDGGDVVVTAYNYQSKSHRDFRMSAEYYSQHNPSFFIVEQDVENSMVGKISEFTSHAATTQNQ